VDLIFYFTHNLLITEKVVDVKSQLLIFLLDHFMGYKYIKIYEQIKQMILKGELKKDAQLPGSRDLAVELGVSRNTILEAFAHLETEGYIESRHGSGVYVAVTPDLYFQTISKRKEVSNRPESHCAEPNTRFGNLFRPGEPELAIFPYNKFSRLISDAVREVPEIELLYNDTTGYLPLRKEIAEYLSIKRGVVAAPEQIVIVNGSQESIYISASLFINRSNHPPPVYLENPCYPLARKVFEESGAKIIPVPVDSKGLVVEKIQPKKNGVVYVTPSHQFPLGYTLSIDRRWKLLEAAHNTGMVIFEDDFDSDYRYTGEPISSLQGLAPDQPVFYFGTFSKIMFPALRIGYCIVPRQYLEPFLAKRKLINRQPSIILQVALARFMKEKHLYRHLKKTHTLYRNRKKHLKQKLMSELSEWLEINDNNAGMHLTTFFKKSPPETFFIQARNRGISLRTLMDFYHPETKQIKNGLIFNFTAVNLDQIDEGVEALKKLFTETEQKEKTD